MTATRQMEIQASHLAEYKPGSTLNHAVEYAVREDILMAIEDMELSDRRAKALLASPDTTSDVYRTFSKMVDTVHMDVIRESIQEQAEALIKSGLLEGEYAESKPLEGVFLVDDSSLLHLKKAKSRGMDMEL